MLLGLLTMMTCPREGGYAPGTADHDAYIIEITSRYPDLLASCKLANQIKSQVFNLQVKSSFRSLTSNSK